MDNNLIIQSNSYDAYSNLALEEYILRYMFQEKKVILLLWQNDNAVIIGRNQNARNECNFEAMKKYGTKLVRRNTGGGAVYHDKGNLNFSILCPIECYDIMRSIEVIRRAIGTLGIVAEYSGRNDLLVKGYKFSGNAFLTNGEMGLHHGTILINSDFKIMEEVLKTPKEKLEPKGIDSIKSRVINLNKLCKFVTVESVSKSIMDEFIREYGCKDCGLVNAQQVLDEQKSENFHKLVKKYSSEDWNMGYNFNYNYVVKKHFEWGQCEIRLLIKEGIIERNCIYSDSLFPNQISKIEKGLNGLSLEMLKEKNATKIMEKEIKTERYILKDILSLIINI